MAEFDATNAAARAPEPALNIDLQANGVAPSEAEALAKYEQERLKRLRPDGNAQYIDPSLDEKLSRFQNDVWVTEATPNPGLANAKDGDKYRVAILGTGFGGLTTAARLVQAGIDDLVLLDIAGGFGGTWYWNRYPGLMCDVESYIYMPLLEEMDYVPKQKYSSGSELREYAEMIADKFKLREKAIFRVKVKTATWDEDKNQYAIVVERLDGKGELRLFAEILVSHTGAINLPKMPNLPGMGDFTGHSFHTSRWDYEYTGGSQDQPAMVNLKDKRVGFVGTGATAVQAVPELAKWAKELYVFQRTPSAVDVRNNRDTDIAWFNKNVRGTGPGWQRRRQENFNLLVSDVDQDVDLVDDEWTHMRTFSYVVGSPNPISDMASFLAKAQAKDFPRQEKIRKRIDEIVKDKETADKLKPWYSGWCKRPCFHDEYLPAFNRSNVHLVDTNGRGVEKVSRHGIVVAGKEYPLDVIIFGTGYMIKGGDSPAAKANFEAYGKDGVSMDKIWGKGVTTLHGFISDGCPNYFFPGPNQSGASANMVYGMHIFSEHLAYILAYAYKKAQGGPVHIEGNKAAMEDWSQQVADRATAFAAIAGCTPGYLNGEGAAGKPLPPDVARVAVRAALWGTGIQDYTRILHDWKEEGTLKGLEITAV